MRCPCGSVKFIERQPMTCVSMVIFDGQTDANLQEDVGTFKSGPKPKQVECEGCGKKHSNPRLAMTSKQ